MAPDGASASSGAKCLLLPLVCFGLLLRSLALFIVGSFVGLLVLIPVAGITVPSWIAAILLHWPRSFVDTYFTIAVTQRLGPSLRTLALLLLPIPLLAWPLAVVVACLLFSLGVGFFWPLAATVSVGSSLDGGKLLEAACLQPLELTRHAAVEVWRVSDVAFYAYLEELRRPYYGEPLDISLLRLLLVALVSLFCSLVSTLAVLILGMLRLPFIIARALAEWMSMLTRFSPRLACLWLPFWVLGVPCIPVAVLGGFLMVLAGCFAYLGPTCGVAGYMSTSSRPAYRSVHLILSSSLDCMYAHIYSLDEAAVRLTGLGSSSLLPVPPPRHDGRRVGLVAGAAAETAAVSGAVGGSAPASSQPASPEQQAWRSLEELLGAAVCRCVEWGWVPRADLADSEAYLFIGLPALALLQLLADAATVPPSWMPGRGGEAAAAAAAAKEEQEEEEKDAQAKEGSEVERGTAVGAEAAGAGQSASVPLLPLPPPAPAPCAAAAALRPLPEVPCEVSGEAGSAAGVPRRSSVTSDAGSVILNEEYDEQADELPPWRVEASPLAASQGCTSTGQRCGELSGLTPDANAPSQPGNAPATSSGEDKQEGRQPMQRQQQQGPCPAAATLEGTVQGALVGGPGDAAGSASAAAAASATLAPEAAASTGASLGALPVVDGEAGVPLPSLPAPAPSQPAAEHPAGSCAVAVAVAGEVLDPAAAHLLLEELAEHVLTSDIGFHSAANPVKLQHVLASLQVTPLEMRYMAAHTVLVGDPRVGELVPLEVLHPHHQHSHAASKAADAAGHGAGAAPSGAAAGAGDTAGVAGHSQGHNFVAGPARRQSRWSLNGMGSRAASATGPSTAEAGAAAHHPRESGGLRLFGFVGRNHNTASGYTSGHHRRTESGGHGAAGERALPGEPHSPPAVASAALPPLPRRSQRRRTSSLGGDGSDVEAAAGATVADVQPASGPLKSQEASTVGVAMSLHGKAPANNAPGGGAAAQLSLPAAIASVPTLTKHVRVASGTSDASAPASPPFHVVVGVDAAPSTQPAAPAPTAAQATSGVASSHQQHGHGHGHGQGHSHSRWPFRRGHRRTHSQPVGMPAGGHAAGSGAPLVPPSPRSVPGGVDSPFATAEAVRQRKSRPRPSEPGVSAGAGAGSDVPVPAMQGADAPALASGFAAVGAAAGVGPLSQAVTPQRLAQLHAFTAAVQSVATALSKKARMKEMMGRLLTRHGTCGSSVCEEAPGEA